MLCLLASRCLYPMTVRLLGSGFSRLGRLDGQIRKPTRISSTHHNARLVAPDVRTHFRKMQVFGRRKSYKYGQHTDYLCGHATHYVYEGPSLMRLICERLVVHLRPSLLLALALLSTSCHQSALVCLHFEAAAMSSSCSFALMPPPDGDLPSFPDVLSPCGRPLPKPDLAWLLACFCASETRLMALSKEGVAWTAMCSNGFSSGEESFGSCGEREATAAGGVSEVDEAVRCRASCGGLACAGAAVGF